MSPTSGTTERGEMDVRLPPRPSSVSEARHHVRALLEEGGRPELVDPVLLVVSEVVTNALLHAGTEIDLAVRLRGRGVRVEVGDGSPHLPARRGYAATAGTGRGLMMLESTVDDWGVTRRDEGKTVWFELGVAGPPTGPGRPRPGPDGSEPPRSAVEQQATDSVAVELRNMPLLLHAAWQEYAEGLLREYLLASLDEEGEDSVQVHAEATDAISILEEHVPQLSVRIAPDELMSDAVEPRVSVRLLDVPVPRASVPHFQTLDRAIEAALDLSRLGLVLTPPTPPEVQAFRRWLCGQVLDQAAGRRSEPWLLPAGDAPDPVPLPDEPPAVPAAVVLADETSRIVAVGTEVAALLGYDPAELVGERLVSIIPERYRQAHVAGFTMYLLVDRRPLVGHTVAVPALRRDGSEVSVDLLIREQPAGEGHTLLFAELRPRQG